MYNYKQEMGRGVEMFISHVELQNIYDTLLSESVKQGINEFVEQELDVSEFYYTTDCLWKADYEIGGIGGYCMPSNPTENPFPAGDERALYRPLQYARNIIDRCDIRVQARFVIECVGMHLEAACRMYLKKHSKLGGVNHSTLGKAVQKIKRIGDFDDYIITSLFEFVVIYNKAKHEINQMVERERLFNAYDAVVAYFSARVLGVIILQELEMEESLKKYRICE